MSPQVSTFKIGTEGTIFSTANIDQMCVWNKELSLEEIREAIQLNSLEQHSAYANLISWYEFEDAEIVGTTLMNRISGAPNATLYNGATNSKDINYPRTYQLEPNDNTPYAENDTGWALDFDGTNEYVNIPDADELSFGANPFSVSVWLNRDEIRNKFIIEKKNEYDFRGSNATRYFFTCYDTNTSNYIRVTSTATDAPAGEWINVTVTIDGSGLASGLTLYQNGVLISSTNTTVGTYVQMQNTTSDLTLGRTSAAYEGLMDNVCLFEKELTQAEVLQIVNEHQVRNETEFSLVSNLVGYWRGVNSRTGTDGVIDQSGNGNHGTMTNMTDSDVVLSSPRPIFNEATKGSTIFESGDNITVPSNADFSFSSGGVDRPITICFNIHPTSMGFRNLRGPNKPGEWQLNGYTLSQPRFILFGTGGNLQVVSPTRLLDDIWYQICIVYDGTGATNSVNAFKIYVNGVDVPVTNNGSGAYTGAITNSNDLQFNDTMENNMTDFCVIHKALTPPEVDELYNDGSPPDLTEVTFASDVKHWWKLDATEDLTVIGGVIDQIGTSDGTAINMTIANTDLTDYPIN